MPKVYTTQRLFAALVTLAIGSQAMASNTCEALFKPELNPGSQPGAPGSAAAASRGKAAKPTTPLEGRLLTPAEMVEAKLVEATKEQKIDKYQKALNARRIALIDHVGWVEKVLKSRYKGWDIQITSMMTAIQGLIVRADTNDGLVGPIVIPLMTFPGYGKTSIVMDLVDLLSAHPDLAYIKSAFDRKSIAKNTPYLELDSLGDGGTMKLDADRPITRIVFWDEAQNIVKLSHLYKLKQIQDGEARRLKLEERDGVSSVPAEDANYVKTELAKMGAALGNDRNLTLDNIITERERMIRAVWDITGNGRAYKVKSSSPSDLANELNEHVERYEMETRFREWDKAVKNLELKKKEYEEALAESNRKKKDEDLKEAASDAKEELRQAQYKFDNAQQASTNYVQNPAGFEWVIRAKVKEIVDEVPEVLALMGAKNAEEIIQRYPVERGELLEKFYKALDSIPTDQQLDYRRMIIFIAGNPTEAINDIFDRAQVDKRSLDPDALHRLAESPNGRRLTQDLFEDIWGKDEALKSRLKISKWDLIPPFKLTEWMKLVRSEMDKTRDRFFDTLKKISIPNKMDIDLELKGSVEELLRKHAIDTLGGPRVFTQNATGFLSILDARLPLMLNAFPKDHRIWKSNRAEAVRELGEVEVLPKQDSPYYEYKKVTIKGKPWLVRHWHKVKLEVNFDEATNSFKVIDEPKSALDGRFIIAGRNSNQEFTILGRDKHEAKDKIELTLDLGEKVEVKKKPAGPVVTAPDPIRVRNAYFQAARAVVGMMSFRSAPKLVADSSTTADQAIHEMWSVSNRDNLDFWMAEAKAFLAAYAIERSNPQLSRVKQSDLTKTELILLATTNLDKIADELATRKKYAAFLRDVESESPRIDDILPKDLANNPIFENTFRLTEEQRAAGGDGAQAIRNPIKAKVLRHLYEEVVATIDTQKDAIESIAAHLMQRGPADGDVVKNIVRNRFVVPKRGLKFWKTPEEAGVKTAIESAPIGQAFDMKAPSASASDFEAERKSAWRRIFHGE